MELQGTQAFVAFDEIVASIAACELLPADKLDALVAEAKGDWQFLHNVLTEQGLLSSEQFEALRAGRITQLRLGNYEILDMLGAGGMGTVYKARHRRMKRMVALKVLAAMLSKNAAFVQRFQREVETIARLGHPNIVMAYDADEAEIGHFLVMEFVNGKDLAAIVSSQGPMTVLQAVDCMLQSAKGLAYAHSQGIIHRDIKPHNLLRDESGLVKVTDLGLARATLGAEAGGFDVTMAGGVIGTADFMSPEQAVDSTTIDHKADIYSLGATLHYLLTGRPPYSGPTIMSILLKHREAPIPQLRAIRSDVPQALDDLLQRMMAKNAAERIPNMDEVVHALSAIVQTCGMAADSAALPGAAASVPRVSPSASSVSLKRAEDGTLEMEGGTGPRTVLIVEPSRAQASIIRTFLQEHGYLVTGAVQTAAEAIEQVRANKPQVVVSSMHLRDISGVELASQIRSEIKQNAPGFILVTTESTESETTGLSRLHRVHLLPKPFTAHQLAGAIDLVSGKSLPLTCELFPQAAKRANRAALKVLIVDDSGAARIHERMVLQKLGFSQFMEASDGAQAIAAATRESFDLIVTDYNMPLMDGRALVSYLKQNPPTVSTPILMVTTETSPKILDPVRALGVLAIVDKQFSAEVVSSLLDKVF